MLKIILAVVLCAITAPLIGCATDGAGLGAIQAKQQHRLYTRCVDAQMKQADFGSGMAVHRACLEWSTSRR